jgi:glycosyltransferase involved in cell wall biosynthesis
MMVSCLLVTLPIPERFDYAKASIAAFCSQTHGSKELIIVVDPAPKEGRARLVEYVNSLQRNDIRIVVSPEKFTLGRLRNLSIDSAQGDVLCQWDDDDLYHPQRLECQLTALQENECEAVYMRDVMQYFPKSKTLYWTNWQSTEAGGHPGTLMVRRSVPIRYPTEGASARLGEDLCVALYLKERGHVCFLTSMPHLFVYVSHGKNSWDEGHHQMLASELSISRGLLQRREKEIRDGLSPFNFGAGQLNVRGRNGVAFTVEI